MTETEKEVQDINAIVNWIPNEMVYVVMLQEGLSIRNGAADMYVRTQQRFAREVLFYHFCSKRNIPRSDYMSSYNENQL